MELDEFEVEFLWKFKQDKANEMISSGALHAMTYVFITAQLLSGCIRQRFQTKLFGNDDRQQPTLRREWLAPP